MNKLITLIIAFIILNINANADSISSENTRVQTVSIQEKLAKLEASSGGRIGIYAMNMANNKLIQYRADERFPFCSTSKLMVVAAILNKSESDSTLLQKRIKYSKEYVDKSGYAPITKQHISNGMTIAELCAAAIDYSDNVAMNLLIKNAGGIAAVNKYARSINDNKFNLSRLEPELNTAIPNDVRDTTTPAAMGNSLQRLVLGDALQSSQREKLITWLKNNTTGDARIRAGVPKGWIVADKTGTGDHGTSNDIGVIWSPNGSPIVLVIYTTQSKNDATSRDKLIASATRIVIENLYSGVGSNSVTTSNIKGNH